MIVIGGLVDRSVSRHMTAGHAAGHGVATTARLPLREHCPMHNNALNIDTVVKILLEKSAGLDWAEALQKVIPQCRRQQQQPGPRKAAADAPPPSNHLYIAWGSDGAAVAGVQHSLVAAECRKHGAIATTFDKERCFGWGEWTDTAHATSAKARLHRCTVGGAQLRVAFAKGRPDAEPAQPHKKMNGN